MCFDFVYIFCSSSYFRKNSGYANINVRRYSSKVGRDSSVGIATRYELNGPGIEPRWEATFSTPVQTGPEAHPPTCVMGTG